MLFYQCTSYWSMNLTRINRGYALKRTFLVAIRINTTRQRQSHACVNVRVLLAEVTDRPQAKSPHQVHPAEIFDAK
jgi:hypothetical protein